MVQPSMETSTSNEDLTDKILKLNTEFFVEERLIQKIECKVRTKPLKIFKKDSLKFSRRLCRSVLRCLGQGPFYPKLIDILSSLTKIQLAFLGGLCLDEQKLSQTLRPVFILLWKGQRETLTYWKNKKISLITVAEWDSIFTFKGFCERIRDIMKDIQRVLLFTDEIDKQTFDVIFFRLVFTFHLMIIHTILFTELSQDFEFHTKVRNVKDFLLMATEPWLYKHYNHSSGMFALECCGKCKICRSSLVSRNFLVLLSEARKRFEIICAFYRALMLDINNISDEKMMILLNYWSQNSGKTWGNG